MKKQIDYMRPSGVKHIKINDRTKDKHGLPTFKAMERQLTKSLRYA